MLMFCVLSIFSVQAQQTISFDEALNMMLESNRVIEGAKLGVDAAHSEYRAAKGGYMPQVELVGNYSYLQHDVDIELGGAKGLVTESLESLINKGVGDGIITPTIATLLGEGLSPILGADWRYTLQKRNFGFVETTVTMPIYLGGRINSVNRVARLGLEGAYNELDGVTNSLITELVERYYGVILSGEVIKVREAVVRGVEQHLSDALAMEEEGIVAHSVILYLEYKLSDARREYTDAVNEHRVAKLALMTTLQSSDILLPDDALFLASNIYDIEYYKDNAIKSNTLIREVNLARSVAKEGVNIAKSSMLPAIVAMGGASIYNHNVSGLIPRWAVGVGVSVPIFGGLSRQSQYKAAQYREQSVVQMVEKAKESILLLVDKEYYTLQNGVAAIESCRRSIDFAQSYYQTSLDGFYEGVTSSSELMDARTALAGAGVEYLNAVYEYTLSLARLLELSGLSSEFVLYKSSAEIVDINSVIR